MVTSEPVDEIRGRDHSNEFPFLSVLNSGSDRSRKGICIGVAPPQAKSDAIHLGVKIHLICRIT